MRKLVVERMKMEKKQFEVAHDLGVTSTHISNIERGKEKPSEELSKKLENYYGKEIGYLLEDI